MNYTVRVLKYFVAFSVFCMAIVALNLLVSSTPMTLDEFVYVTFHTPRGMMLPVVVVLLSLVMPRIDFITRRVEGDVEENRTQIDNAMKASGFEYVETRDEQLIYHASSFLTKLMLLWDDEMKVSQYGQWIEVSGKRRAVARIVYRLDSYLGMLRRDE